MSPRVEILIPTHNHPLLLPFAVATAQEQSAPAARIVVIGDGVGDDTRDVMASLCRDDPDLVFLDLPKAGRTGEPHRHRVLADSRADVVTYHSDDDLLFPDHVERMLALLDHADVVMPMGAHLRPDGTAESSPWSLGEEPGRTMALGGTSLFSLSGITHTMAAYRRLPFGWRETPDGFYTDQYMLLQFLAEPWCRFDVDDVPTTVHLADSLRRDMSASQRFEEMSRVDDWMRHRDGWREYRHRVQSHLRRTAAQSMVDLHSISDHLGLVSRENEELRARLDEMATQDSQLQARIGDAERTISELVHALDARSREVEALMATRTMRLRRAFVCNRFVRAVLRRP